MKRRTVLGYLAGLVSGGAITHYNQGKLIKEAPQIDWPKIEGFGGASAENANTWPKTERLGGPFNKIDYHRDGTATLTFSEFHEVDGFYLMYHQYDDINNALQTCGAPDAEPNASVQLNLQTLLTSKEGGYPDQRFNLVAVTGGGFPACATNYDDFTVVTNTVHTATITPPASFFDTGTPAPPEPGQTITG